MIQFILMSWNCEKIDFCSLSLCKQDCFYGLMKHISHQICQSWGPMMYASRRRRVDSTETNLRHSWEVKREEKAFVFILLLSVDTVCTFSMLSWVLTMECFYCQAPNSELCPDCNLVSFCGDIHRNIHRYGGRTKTALGRHINDVFIKCFTSLLSQIN